MLIPIPPKNKQIKSKVFKRSHKIISNYDMLVKNLVISIINQEEILKDYIKLFVKDCINFRN